ncbi:MAG: hypothetical protein FJX52_12140 [Alphaproteobacteria bacterium]|nr:hypothetical protein [Alphaproteobacteria bacterium]
MRAGLQWWLDELALMAPPTLRRWVMGEADLVALERDGHGYAIMRARAGAWRKLAAFAGDGRARTGAMAEILGAVGSVARPAIVLVLPPERAVTRRLVMPLAAEPELGRALGFEIERHMPFPVGQACFFHEVAQRDRGAGTIAVDVVVAPREVVDGAVAEARALGLDPAIVTVRTGVNSAVLPAEPRLLVRRNFLADDRLIQTPPHLRRRRQVLAWCLALGLAAAALSPLVQTWHALGRGERDLAAARQRAETVLALERRGARIEADIAAILAAKASAPAMTGMLEALSAALPDDTSLTYLGFAGGQVVIEGRSASAAALVRRLEAVPGFGKVGFAAPIMRNARDGQEHFQFTIALTGAGR